MANNFLKYSSLTYDTIIKQITDRLNSDPRFANFRESSIAQTLVEIFAGTTDIINYYIERRAEESFFDTAKLRSSVILLARSLGYVTNRSIPAEARIKLKIKGNLEKINSTSTIQIPINSVFSYNGLKFILKKDLILKYDQFSTLVSNNSETDYILEDYNGNDIGIVQGEIKEKFIDGSTNPQVGSIFQIYRIEDKEFCNKYGDADYDNPVTRVWVGNDKNIEYTINRRSLIDWNVIKNSVPGGDPQNVCVVRTAISEGIEILFGDGNSTAKGPETTSDNVYIQYLATKGYESNQVGCIDKSLQFAGKVFDSNGNDITSKVKFYFDTNITGGADMEDIESIRVNAPNIYYSLDRLVSKRDYVSYLKSLTSPIVIKNAIAWGEQEELRQRNLTAMIRMFNIVFFSVVGHLYQTDSTPYFPKTAENGLDTAVLDYNYGDDELNQRNYFNVFTKGYSTSSSNLVEQLEEYQTTTFIWVLNGNGLDHDKDGQYFSNHYGNSFKINVNYTTSLTPNNPSLTTTKEITANIDTIGGMNYDDAMFLIASSLTTSLLAMKDERGFNSDQNANYGLTSFPNIEVTYEPEHIFKITHDLNSPCYITSFEDTSQTTDNIANDLGFQNPSVNSESLNIKNTLSKKIVDVVNDLDERSQVTIRNIYISPVIQTMILSGTVYLKNLFDIQKEKVNIENAIYKWLDDNADFNVEIYKSNIIDLIQSHPSVYYVNADFVPEYPVNPAGGKFYQGDEGGHNSNIDSVSIPAQIYGITNTRIGYDLYVPIHNTNINSPTIKSITERYFLEVFAKNLYLDLIGVGRIDFADSDNFINLINDIHKDYLGIIRNNLLDTRGNIGKDVIVQNGKPIAGGYSLGNEIVKIIISLNYQYKA